MDPLTLPRPRRGLVRALGDEVVGHPGRREELRIVEVADHPVVWKVLEQEGDPAVGIGPHREIDESAVDLAPQLDAMALGLDGDRLSRPPSPVLRDARLRRP